MGKSSVPVDLLNPGQVFACLGFMEAAEQLFGRAEGRFDWSDDSDISFHLDAPEITYPVNEILQFLLDAEVDAVAPRGYNLSAEKWNIATKTRHDDYYPFKPPSSPATLVARLKRDGFSLSFEHWGDSTSRDNVKFWAGAGGYPGAALLRDAQELIRSFNPLPSNDPLNAAALQSSAFRFDWRRDYVPVDVGFSPNAHSDLVMTGFPVVEVMAALGLAHARPRRVEPRNKLLYQYSVIGNEAPLLMHRPALGATELPFPQRFFSMHLDWPGKEGQARCITQVMEI